MSYSWTTQSDSEASYAEKIPPGRHRLKITKIKFGSANGTLFNSKGGDPQILLIFSDQQAREASQMVTLSDKAAWTLAKLMSCFDPPMNLQRLEADGIVPQHFADEAFATTNLLDRELVADVAWEKGADQKDYANIAPVKPDAAPAAGAPAATNRPKPPTQSTPAARSTPPRMPAPSPDADAPPAIEDGPPAVPAGLTKAQAWEEVKKFYVDQGGDTNETKAKRNQQWEACVRGIGKPETAFTPQDWMQVADQACVPF